MPVFGAVALVLAFTALLVRDGQAAINSTNTPPGETLVLLKSGETNLFSYGLYCLLSGARSGAAKPPGQDLILVLRNSGAKNISLQFTEANFTIKDATGNQMKLALPNSPDGIGFGSVAVIDLKVLQGATAPEPWTFHLQRAQGQLPSLMAIDLLIEGVSPTSAAAKFRP